MCESLLYLKNVLVNTAHPVQVPLHIRSPGQHPAGLGLVCIWISDLAHRPRYLILISEASAWRR